MLVLEISGPLARQLGLIQSKHVHELAGYWCGKLAGRAMPARSDIEPMEMRPWLPFVALSEVAADTRAIRFRLGGEAICDSYRCNVAGRLLADLNPPGGVASWLAAFDRVVAGVSPVVGLLRASLSGGDRVVEWALLPLSYDGRTVHHVLQIEDWHALHRVPRSERYDVPWRAEIFE